MSEQLNFAFTHQNLVRIVEILPFAIRGAAAVNIILEKAARLNMNVKLNTGEYLQETTLVKRPVFKESSIIETNKGFIKAGDLKVGDYLVNYG